MSSGLILEIKNRIPLEDYVRRHVDLKSSSGKLVGRCPFHDENDASFMVYPDGHWHCYGCQKHGDLIEFAQLIHGYSFKDVIKALAEEAGVQMSSPIPSPINDKIQRFKKILNHTQGFWAAMLTSKRYIVQAYLDKRGLTEGAISAFGLGFAPDEWQSLYNYLMDQGVIEEDALELGVLGQSDSGRVYDRFRNRLIFPIHNRRGEVVGFGGRDRGDNLPKYVNSPESLVFKKGECLYGIFQAQKAIRDEGYALVTEGYVDVVSMNIHGFLNGVGVLGTAFTKRHALALADVTSKVVLLFDGDKAGRKAAVNAARELMRLGLGVRVGLLPEGEDVDSLLQGRGRTALDEVIRFAQDGLEFCAAHVQESMSPRDIQQWIAEFLSGVESQFIPFFVPRLAKAFELSEIELRKILKGGSQMYGAEKEILGFVLAHPPYMNAVAQAGVNECLTSQMGKDAWNRILEGKPVEGVKYAVQLEGMELINRWKQIKKIIEAGQLV